MNKLWGWLKIVSVAGIWAFMALFASMNSLIYPFDHYFHIGSVVVPLKVKPDGFLMDVTAHPKVVFDGSYKVLLRSSATGLVVKEYPNSGVFPYKPRYDDDGNQLPGYPDAVGFDWWVGLKGKLPPLPAGLHYAETCWTIHSRPWPLGDTTGCVDSNQFRVFDETSDP